LDRVVIVAKRFGDRDQLHAMLRQLAQVKFLSESIAEEAAIAVHVNYVERMLPVASTLDHLLKNWALVVGR
jgi:hypothetical protein